MKNLTVTAAMKDPSVSLLDCQRLLQWRRKLYAQLDGVGQELPMERITRFFRVSPSAVYLAKWRRATWSSGNSWNVASCTCCG